MSPISDQFHYVFIGCAFFAGCALLFLAAGRYRLLVTVPPVGLAGFAIWLFANVGDYEYAGLGEMIAISALAVTLCAAAVWVLIARIIVNSITRRSSPGLSDYGQRALSILIVTAPALVLSAVFFERQLVPVAACSTDGVTFRVGEISYFVPPDFGAWIKTDHPIADRPRSTPYSKRTRDKEDMNWICGATANGTRPLKVDALELNVYTAGPFLEEVCGTELGRTKNYCAGYSPSMLENVRSVHFTTRSDRLMSSKQSWFLKKRPDVTAGGDLTDGFVCIEETYNNSYQCSSWKPIDGETFVFAQTQRFPDVKPDELVRNLDEAIAFFQKTLVP